MEIFSSDLADTAFVEISLADSRPFKTSLRDLRAAFADAFEASNGGVINTILSGSGTPDPSQGRDGDFYINLDNYEIFGPRNNGNWGNGTPLTDDPPPKNIFVTYNPDETVSTIDEGGFITNIEYTNGLVTRLIDVEFIRDISYTDNRVTSITVTQNN